jgi:hypothetical protein
VGNISCLNCVLTIFDLGIGSRADDGIMEKTDKLTTQSQIKVTT